MKENKEKLNLKEALKNLKRTIKYLKPYKKQVFLNVLLTLIITVLSVLGPLLSAKLMIYLTNGNFIFPFESIFIIFLDCSNCVSNLFTSITFLPLPLAILSFLDAFNISGCFLS